jgi:hypothetical protein
MAADLTLCCVSRISVIRVSVCDIGERLSIASLTTRNHVQNILDKLEVHSKSAAVASRSGGR